MPPPLAANPEEVSDVKRPNYKLPKRRRTFSKHLDSKRDQHQANPKLMPLSPQYIQQSTLGGKNWKREITGISFLVWAAGIDWVVSISLLKLKRNITNT